MRITFLGKASESGESPTLFATDRDSYIVQGYIVTDAATLSSLQVPDGHAVVEVYARLLYFLAEDGVPGAVTRRRRADCRRDAARNVPHPRRTPGRR